jgi:hypothetical protein
VEEEGGGGWWGRRKTWVEKNEALARLSREWDRSEE